jgi:hypothetical protein
MQHRTPYQKLLELAEEIGYIADGVEEGKFDELDVHLGLKELEEIVKASKKKIEEHVLDEFDKYGEKEIEKHGKVISKVSGRGKYSYDHYEPYVKLNNERKDLETKMKSALKAGGGVLNEDTGELVPPAEYSPGKESIRVTTKK